MGQAIERGDFGIPPPSQLPGSDVVLPNYLIGDEAFALANTMMKPYPRKQCLHDSGKAIFNYRLSRARRVVENAFGIMASYFRVYHTPILVKPQTTDKIILATCILHNMMRSARIASPIESTFGSTNDVVMPTENLQPISSNSGRPNERAANIRELLKQYLNGPGSVRRQQTMIE